MSVLPQSRPLDTQELFAIARCTYTLTFDKNSGEFVMSFPRDQGHGSYTRRLPGPFTLEWHSVGNVMLPYLGFPPITDGGDSELEKREMVHLINKSLLLIFPSIPMDEQMKETLLFKTIRQQRLSLETERITLKKSYQERLNQIDQELQTLQSNCPHLNVVSWGTCEDCGLMDP